MTTPPKPESLTTSIDRLNLIREAKQITDHARSMGWISDKKMTREDQEWVRMTLNKQVRLKMKQEQVITLSNRQT